MALKGIVRGWWEEAGLLKLWQPVATRQVLNNGIKMHRGPHEAKGPGGGQVYILSLKPSQRG